MQKIISFGEALIDFVALESGVALADVGTFARAAGGAPANVAAAVARLGGSSYFAGKVGDDPFGHHIATVLGQQGVKLDYLSFTREAKTALAFVALEQGGEREFTFYREPSADMLIAAEEIEASWFSGQGIFHFGSISFTHPISADATVAALELAREAGWLISFDPNLRFSLWPSPEAVKETVMSTLDMVDLLKVSGEELAFLYPDTDEEVAALRLLESGPSLVIVTHGPKGCRYHSKAGSGQVASLDITAIDTTGAGDAFVGALLYQLAQYPVDRDHGLLTTLTTDRPALEAMLAIANRCGAITATRRGAIPALPTRQEVESHLGAAR